MPAKLSIGLCFLLPSCSLLTIKPPVVNLLPPSHQDTPAVDGPEPVLTDETLNAWLKNQLLFQSQTPIPQLP